MSRQSRSDGMMNAKLILAVMLALLAFSGSAGLASALGVTPGRTTVDFEPGLEKKLSFTITNNEHKKFDAYIYIEGDLSEYITLDRDILSFEETDNSKGVEYTVRLPERIDTPGDHWAKIITLELPKGFSESEGNMQVTGTVAVIHQLRVKVPYPGRYVQLDLLVQDAPPNESVRFFVKLYNLGKEDIASARATIQILGPTNEVIDTIETGSTAIKSMERGELTAAWKADANPGMYHAAVTVRYDGEIGKVEKNFYVGNMLIEVLGVSVKDFRLGGVAKFDIQAESMWNQPIEDVYAQMVISDASDNKVADFKSASTDVAPYERTHLYAYWDTEGVNEGDYVARLTLNYAGRTVERELKTKVGLESIITEIVGVSVGAVTGEGSATDQSMIMILVVALISINLAWFMYFRKRIR
ncbi:MAG: hypothetical protein JXC85_02615 [Candidatus Aenigmarchaeota archaeon]|nr:hypothetical protein [Candidatus Aenigmarchaeota archaeon]